MFKRFPFIHNHGDFVHLDAMRDWVRGVTSLESFLKSKNDKAIVKDIHFTDERTTVDYIDTKDDSEKTETLCEYLTSSIYDTDDPEQQNKVDKIVIKKDVHGENRIDVREKASKKERTSAIISDVPVAYDTNANYNGGKKTHHIGVSDDGVNIYDDDTLTLNKQFKFKNIPHAYDATDDYNSAKKTNVVGFNSNGVVIYDDNNNNKKIKVYDYTTRVEEVTINKDPYESILENGITTVPHTMNNGGFKGIVVNGTVIGGQIVYEFTTPVQIEANGTLKLEFRPINDTSIQFANFANTVYPKAVTTPDVPNILTSLMQYSTLNYTLGSTNIVTLYNPSDTAQTISSIQITF